MNLPERIRRVLFHFSQGRLLSLFLLVLACLALFRIEDTPLASLHAAQFDRYQRQMPRPREEHPAVVVGIDSRSLVEYGQWPWPRDKVAQLIEKIQAGEPLVVGLDILFAERDRYSPSELGLHLTALPANILHDLPDPDARLAQALNAWPSVLAVSGVMEKFPGTRLPHKPLGALKQSEQTAQHLLNFPGGLASLPILEQAASGEGFINASPEGLNAANERGVLRSVPTLALIEAQPFLSLPLEMVRVALGEQGQVEVETGLDGITRIHVGAYSLPTQPDGGLLLHFGKAHTLHYVSAAEVLAGRVAPDFFASRLVLIGFTTSGLKDRILTPLGDSLPGVEVHVQVIESLLSGAALRRPPWLAQFEIAALALSGMLLIGIIPAMRPRYAIAAFVGLGAFWILGGYAAFHFGRWLFDASAIVLLLSPMFMTLLSATWMASDQQRRNAESSLQRSREEAARVSGELDAARRIQMGLLPDPAKVFAAEQRIEIAALLEPARAVGGDFYDCFALDPQRICFAIADVSGKGLPASLFMAVSKTLTGALARRTADIGQALREVEIELNRENPEFLFVTAFVGALDLETGCLDFVRAGHDAPLLLRDGQISRIDDTDASGPPLCALGDFPYRSMQFQLQAGDRICLFTDGVSEAGNGQSLFGIERLASAFAALNPQLPATQHIKQLRDCVRDFEAGQAPADDLTLLLLRWHGPAANGLSGR